MKPNFNWEVPPPPNMIFFALYVPGRGLCSPLLDKTAVLTKDVLYWGNVCVWGEGVTLSALIVLL